MNIGREHKTLMYAVTVGFSQIDYMSKKRNKSSSNLCLHRQLVPNTLAGIGTGIS